jgi:hypothetical protein
MKPVTPVTKKDSWTEAGSHEVKANESAGRKYESPFIISALEVLTPVSPPFYWSC